MPDQVKLEPPPGQTVIVYDLADDETLLFRVGEDPLRRVSGLQGESRMIAACVGACLWHKEAERLWSERNRRKPLSIEWIKWRHAQAQIVAWERWGGLT